MAQRESRPLIVGFDDSVFKEGIPVSADELPRERTTTVTGRAAADAIRGALLSGKKAAKRD